jgi:dihydrodipicolinate synthase/N-acetylneuraminate lyase
MRTAPITQADLRGVFPVPPLCRNEDPARSLNLAENDRLRRHLAEGGITRFLYGGNAFLYHITLADYEALLDWMSGFPDDAWAIPSVGPSFGRALDQAPLVRKHAFPCAMVLPSGDPRNARGLEQGYREIAGQAGCPLICYLKDESNFGRDKLAGLDAVARLIGDGVCVGVKYAVVRDDPSQDAYLEALLERVDRRWVISGIGERPGVAHMRDFGLPGFTTGSGCIAPAASQEIFEAAASGDFDRALAIREDFLPLEDLRDLWGPAPVLHSATALAGVARTGPILPYLAPLTGEQLAQLEPVARALLARNRQAVEA